ncbi:hypothetical protein DFH07DRAFT_1006962, partial [Mycena maculata]
SLRIGLGSFYRTVAYAVGRLTNLAVFDISNSRSIFKCFSDKRFPNLLVCTIPFMTNIISFLKGYPQIYYLHAIPCADGGLSFCLTSPTQSVSMPKLQCFAGPDHIACTVIPGSQVSDMTVYWLPDRSMKSSDCLVALARPKVDVVCLKNVMVGWDCGILLAIANHMPHVEHLEFQNLSDYKERELFISRIESALCSLPQIKCINLFEGILQTPKNYTENEATQDAEFEAVRRWGDQSASLNFITFPSIMRWVRFGAKGTAWLPWLPTSIATSVHSNCRWLFKTVVTVPDLPPIYASLAEYLAGLDGLLAVKTAINNGEDRPEFVLARAHEAMP